MLITTMPPARMRVVRAVLITILVICGATASLLSSWVPTPAAAAATPNTANSTTKTAYDAAGKPLAEGASVKPGDTITYALQDSRTATRNDTAPRTLRDTMSSNLAYVAGSLTKLTKSTFVNGMDLTEPTATNWSGGQNIATFTPTVGDYRYLPNGTTPMAQPVLGQNAQFVEATSTPSTTVQSVSNGDGFNPTFVKNSAGQMFVWSITHHSANETIGCQLVSTHQSCSSGSDYWGSSWGTIQDENTLTLGTKGYMGLANEGAASIAIGCADFANVRPGVAPTKCGNPVQIMSGARAGLVYHWASGVFLSGGKVYMISSQLSGRNLLLGCYDPTTNAVCSGFTSSGTPVTLSGAVNGGNASGMLIRSEIWLPNGAFEWTTDSFGGASFCVVPTGTTLRNCSDGTSTISPVATGGNAQSSVPIVSAGPSGGIAPNLTSTDTQVNDATRVTGWCTGTFGGQAAQCYNTSGVVIGMPYPGLTMPTPSNARNHNGTAMPAGQAQAIYALNYPASTATCYDFAARALCAESPNGTTAPGVTWLDIQGSTQGKLYGARMIPGTNNCMISYGDTANFLYWKVSTTGVITANPTGSGCTPVAAAFQNPGTRYCVPNGSGGVAGTKDWDVLTVGSTVSDSTSAVPITSGLVLNYYAYNASTGVRGAQLGSVTVTSAMINGGVATVAKPSFLTYASTADFIVEVQNPGANLSYQLTQYNTADSNPAVCYQAIVQPSCTAATNVPLTNVANWNGTPAITSNTLTLRTAYDGKCLEMEKTAAGTTGPVNGVYTAQYTITVKNTATVPTTYGPITDTPGFTSGVTITGGSWTRNGGAATTLTGTGPYSLGSAGTALAPGATDSYVLRITFTLNPGQSAQITTCDTTPTPGRGLYNKASVVGDNNLTNNDACNPPPATPSVNVAKTAGTVTGPAGPNNTYSATYTVTVQNIGTAPGSYGPVTDQPRFSTNLTPRTATWTGQASGSANLTAASTPAYGFTMGQAGTTIAGGATHTYNVTVTFTFNNTDPATTCNGPGTGLYNTVSLPAGQEQGTPNDNSACVPPPQPPTTAITVEKYGTNCDVGSTSCPAIGAEFAIHDSNPGQGGVALGSMAVNQNPATGFPIGSVLTYSGLQLNKQYWLVETRAPEGSQLLATPIPFTITDQGIQLGSTPDSQRLVAVSGTDRLTLQITDQTVGNLPQSGGTGPLPWAAAGLLLLLLAGLTHHLTSGRPHPARARR